MLRGVHMHFNVYLDEQLAQNLEKFCHDTDKKRNTVVQEALQFYLDQQKNGHWPPEILSFKGVKDFPAFESYRSEFSS